MKNKISINRQLNLFTAFIFMYSLVVCYFCKPVQPSELSKVSPKSRNSIGHVEKTIKPHETAKFGSKMGIRSVVIK